MAQHKGNRGQRIIQRRTVYGQPVVMGERSLVPIADIVTLGRARGTVGQDSVSGWGWGAAQMMPRAVIIEEAGGEGWVKVVDATDRVVRRLAAAALVVSIALTLVRWAVGRQRTGTDSE